MRAAKACSRLPQLSSPPQILFARVLYFRLCGGVAIFQKTWTKNLSTSSHSFPQHHDEKNKDIQIAVWWDLENCSVPNDVNASRVPRRIHSALRSHGIRGPISIKAFGDVSQLSRSTLDAMHMSGVFVNHVQSNGKSISLVADLVSWAAQNPPPAHLFLISDDADFANTLHRLRMNNYNILLACPDGASGALCSAATVMWQWNALTKGESFTGKYFNHPPDGSYGSWYGHNKGTLDNPFTIFKEARTEETVESSPYAKTRQIPKLLANKVRQILHSYPEGITLLELRSELKKHNVALDKDYFGHKKFSQLLLSMPNILRLKINPGDVQPLVYGVVPQRMTDSFDSSSRATTGVENGSRDTEQSPGAANDRNPSPLSPHSDSDNLCHKAEKVTASKHNTVDTVAKALHGLLEESKTLTTPSEDKVNEGASYEVDVQPSYSQSRQVQNEEIAYAGARIGRFWKNMFSGRSGSKGDNSSSSEAIPCVTAEQIMSTSVEIPSKTEGTGRKEDASELNLKISASRSSQPTISSSKHALCGPTGEEERKAKCSQDRPISSKDSPVSGQSAPCKTDEGTQHVNAFRKSNFFSKIFRWAKIWKTNADDHDNFPSKSRTVISEFPKEGVEGVDLSGKEISNTDGKQETHDLFSKTHFWDSIESFLHTSKGSDIISKSKTREEIMRGLQKEGPLMLSALKESHLCRLVNLLINDKKWLKECDSEVTPFKLTFPVKKVCILSHTPGVNGLRSIFSNEVTQFKKENGNQNLQPLENSSGGSVDVKVPKDALHLKAWFHTSCNSNGRISFQEFEKHFERAFDRKLDYATYGYFTKEDLLAACTADTDDQLGKINHRDREVTLSHCRNLLLDFLKHNPQGFNIGLFRPMFHKRYGYALDYQLLGYPKLAALLQIMPGIVIESTTVVPTAMFHPESRRKGLVEEVSAYQLEKKNKIENIVDSKEPLNDEGCVWDELGPISEIDGSKPAMEEMLESDGCVVIDEFSDSEEPSMVPLGKNKRQCNKDNTSSAFLEVLDSYYSRQETLDAKEDEAQESKVDRDEDQMPNTKECMGTHQTQSVDGLVDCSRNRDTKPFESKPLDLMMQKLKPRKNYSFVSE